MAHKSRAVVFSLIIAASPLAAANIGPTPMPAATDSADTRYCLRIEASTDSRIETIRCWTRAEWADQGVNVDADWAKEGVAVLGPREASL